MHLFLDSQVLSDCKLGFETPKKSKLKHVNDSKIQNSVEHVSSTISTPKSSKSRKYVSNENNMITKTPSAVRKQIAKGCLFIYMYYKHSIIIFYLYISRNFTPKICSTK